jgi:hypothetical protein
MKESCLLAKYEIYFLYVKKDKKRVDLPAKYENTEHV